MAINYTIASHTTAFPTKVLAQVGGKHIYNIHLTSDIDNGWFVKKGAWESLDLYTQAAPTTFTGVVRAKAANGNYYVEVTNPGDALFVYQAPIIAEDYSNTFKKESNFYNKKDEVVRAYELAEGDIVEISAKGFKTTPTVGGNVTIDGNILKAAV